MLKIFHLPSTGDLTQPAAFKSWISSRILRGIGQTKKLKPNRQLCGGAGQRIFPDRDVELVNFLTIVSDQALHNGRRNAGFVKQCRRCPA